MQHKRLLIKSGRVIDPTNKIDAQLDILVENSEIKVIAPNIHSIYTEESIQVIDASHYVVVPGLIDVHVHLREPGNEHKETIYTGTRAAAAGGFTTVICQPNTEPKMDTPEVIKLVTKQAQKHSEVNLYPSGCITKNHEKLVNVKELKEAGIVKLTDDGDPVIYDELMEKALEEASRYNIVVSPHCELSPWAEELITSLNLEVGGTPSKYDKEPFFVKQCIELAKKTDAPIFISHISMEKSVNEIARAKHDGVPITCEVTPHHLLLTDEAEKIYGTNAKVNPPLRSSQDVTAIMDALVDGTIDVIASDHAPHGVKSNVWSQAEFGIIGLETTLGLVLTKLVDTKIISLNDALIKLTANPARIFNLEIGQLKVGMPADITIIDLEKEWVVDVNKFRSKSKNCPFQGWKLKGKAVTTIVGGKIVFCE